MGNKGFHFDMTTCIGCRTCQIACKDKNNLKPGALFRQVTTFETGSFPKVGLYHYSGTCNHCQDAKCVKGCPTGAMYHADDGTVQHDKKKCIGCLYCVWNCPYNVPQYLEEQGIVGKCDGCKDLRDKGENPVCVDACIMRSITWGEIEELEGQFNTDSIKDLPILPQSSITTPSLLIKPKTVAFEKDFRRKEV